jgi:autotransporter-associated beta strand protein
LIDAGTGVLTLSNGSNSYGGSTTINNGATLTMSNGSVLGLSTVNVNGTLNLPSTAATINNNIVLTGTINNTSNANMNGTLTIPDNASATINVPGGNFNTFGKIYGTNLATVNKTGGSTQVQDNLKMMSLVASVQAHSS